MKNRPANDVYRLFSMIDTAIAIAFLLAMALCVLLLVAAPSMGDIQIEVQQLECSNDTPLMTEDAKQEARETGYAVYRVGGMEYVDGSLPEEYYKEASWH